MTRSGFPTRACTALFCAQGGTTIRRRHTGGVVNGHRLQTVDLETQ
jgi:hypothetical protein